MKMILTNSEAMLLQLFDSCFDLLTPSIPKLVFPIPLSCARDILHGKIEKNRIEFALVVSPEYEAAIAQTAVWWGLNANGISREQQAAALDLAYEHLPVLNSYDQFLEADINCQVTEILDDLLAASTGNVRPRQKRKAVEILLTARSSIATNRPSNVERNAARKEIRFLFSRLLISFLKQYGFQTKASQIGYLYALQDMIEPRHLYLELIGYTIAHSKPALDQKADSIIRNIKEPKIQNENGVVLDVDSIPYSFWIQGYEAKYETFKTKA